MDKGTSTTKLCQKFDIEKSTLNDIKNRKNILPTKSEDHNTIK